MLRHSRRLSPLAALLLAAASIGCGGSGEPGAAGDSGAATSASDAGAAPDASPRDVLLITLDTARADRFGFAGAEQARTPVVDGLAAGGTAFLQAMSPAPLTLPAHASLFTGRLPPSHGIRDNGAYRLPGSETTLAELLAAAGYDTAAFVGARVLEARYGLDAGFAVYDDAIAEPADGSPFLYYAERPADEVVAAARRWIESRDDDRPLFLWLHLFDPHAPYRAPEPERSRAATPYDGEIAFADRALGELLAVWERRRDAARSLVVFTSDHGEALGEHGEATHGLLVHEATLRVPLVLRGPGVRAGATVEEPVHLIDVLPTLLDLLGLETPAGVQGRSLAPALRAPTGDLAAAPRASGYGESLYGALHHGTAPLLAFRRGPLKLVRGVEERLFDLAGDPGEIRDLARARPGTAEDLASELDALLAAVERNESERAPLDEEARRTLESLGYVWAPAGRAGDADDAPPIPPRRALEWMARMADADRALLQGDRAAAIAAYRAVLEESPASVDARVRLARILEAGGGRPDAAIALLAEAARLAPHEPTLHHMLGAALERAGRYEAALAAYDAGRALHPDSRDLRDGRWRCLGRLGRYATLGEEAEAAVRADPTDGAARWARVIACCARAPEPVYREALERELAELPGDPILRAALAALDAESSSVN